MIRSYIIRGIDPVLVTFEVMPTPGQRFSVELPANVEKETRVRIRAAAEAAGLKLPDVRVRVFGPDGTPLGAGLGSLSGLDLPIALAALGYLGREDEHGPRGVELAAIGELSLSGQVRAVRGVYGAALAEEHRPGALMVPAASWAGLPRPATPVSTLAEAIEAIEHAGRPEERFEASFSGEPERIGVGRPGPDLSEIKLAPEARRALEIAATGRHGLLLLGPPGSGKTMLARRLPGILPKPDGSEARLLRLIADAAGLDRPAIDRRPFRAPHHTVSEAALVGGGKPVRPGEVTLAHGGVLFLDEVTELRRATLEALASALGNGAPGNGAARMPARPECIVAAADPCPCGGAGDRKRTCTCTPARVEHHLSRLRPLYPAVSMRLRLPPPPPDWWPIDTDTAPGESSEVVRERVTQARALRPRVSVGTEASGLIAKAHAARAGARPEHACGPFEIRPAIELTRTIAALAGVEVAEPPHAAEALALVWGGGVA